MKIKNRKQIISLCAVVLILLSGSFITVNAATDGKLAEAIKEKYEEIVVIKVDSDNYKVTEKNGKNEEGEETVTYTVTSNEGDEEYEITANKDVLQKENLKVTDEIKDGETIVNIENEDLNMVYYSE